MAGKRVLVGMSGGIDSTATCMMLQEQGFEVIGVTIRTWDSPIKFSSPEQELPDYILEAKTLADTLSIQHHIADERIRFKELVVTDFVEEYLKGRTPNPCVICNPVLKFKVLMELADQFNCDYIATGHYSRLEKRGEFTYIIVGEDDKKDQSYFLWRLGQDILQRCIFPLGGLTKKEVREYLKNRGFESKSKEGESMEVCFVDNDYRDFLRTHVPDIDQKIGRGMYVNSEGVKIGEHKGYPYYTIGQRKGLEIALGYPAYVIKTNPIKNTVMLGEADKLKTYYMLIEDFHPVNLEDFSRSTDLSVRIRYKSMPIPCELMKIEEEKWLVKFKEEASAVTLGQSAVFYSGKRVLGGAFIASQRGIGMYIQ